MARLWRRVIAQLRKRVLHSSRSWRMLFSQLFAPGLFVLLGMSVALPSLSFSTHPPIEISTAQYVNLSKSDVVIPYDDFTARRNYPYSNLSSRDENLYHPMTIISQLFNPAGPGPVCAIRNPNDTWLEANRPNTSSETLRRMVYHFYFDAHCHQLDREYPIRKTKLENFLLPATR
ncbi:hypothetical protein GCK32_019435, partial [Trichostrongylus colubriformis]